MPLTVVPREEWGAVPPSSRVIVSEAVKFVYCEFTRTEPAFTREEAAKAMRTFQEKDMKKRRPDIKYSFVVASDATVYEGRGWGTLPYLSPIDLEDNTPFVYIGLIWNRDANRGYPPKEMLRIQDELIKYGVENNFIVDDPEKFVLYY